MRINPNPKIKVKGDALKILSFQFSKKYIRANACQDWRQLMQMVFTSLYGLVRLYRIAGSEAG